VGAAQASTSFFLVLARSANGATKKRRGRLEQLAGLKVKENLRGTELNRYGRAAGWIDAIIQPHETRAALCDC